MDDTDTRQTAENDEYARTLVYGEAAINYIKANKTPAYPRCYELWYTYSAGYNRDLNSAVNALLKGGKRVSPTQADKFYSEFLSPLRHADRITNVSEEVTSEVNQILDLIDSASGSVDDYESSLQTATTGLASAVSDDQVRAVVEKIIVATADMRNQNRKLEDQLQESRRQIVEMQESLEAIRFESMTDELTGLANRRHFDESLRRLIMESRNEKSPLCLIIGDIDHFKRFNDTFGHQTGDQVLKLVSSAIRDNVKGQDVPARYGGEEFVILLPNTRLDDACIVAEHVREAIKAKELVKRSTGENLGHVTISFGVATLGAADTANSLIERADSCLYASKRGGRDRVTREDDPVLSAKDVA